MLRRLLKAGTEMDVGWVLLSTVPGGSKAGPYFEQVKQPLCKLTGNSAGLPCCCTGDQPGDKGPRDCWRVPSLCVADWRRVQRGSREGFFLSSMRGLYHRQEVQARVCGRPSLHARLHASSPGGPGRLDTCDQVSCRGTPAQDGLFSTTVLQVWVTITSV